MDNYLVMCDVMSSFFQVYRVPNKSAKQAILKVREWSSFWGKPFEILADGKPGFRNTYEEETAKHKGGCKKNLTNLVPQFLLNFSGYKHAIKLSYISLERWDP